MADVQLKRMQKSRS